MKKISMICLAAGLACTATAVAKPPLQVAPECQPTTPLAFAPVKFENGKLRIAGDWVTYTGANTRAEKAVYYSYDAFEAYVDGVVSTDNYVNHYNGGFGTPAGSNRQPGNVDCLGNGYRWWGGTGYNLPLTIEDVTGYSCFDSAVAPIEALDMSWGEGPFNSTDPANTDFYVAFLTSNDSGDCSTDVNMNTYSGFIWQFGPGSGNAWYTNIDGIEGQNGEKLYMPAAGGSFQIFYSDYFDGQFFYLDTSSGTQPLLWALGDAGGSTTGYRPGHSTDAGWDDDAPTDVSFTSAECYSYAGACLDPLQKSVAFGALRCPADIDNNGFVNALDYDSFASAFELGDACADFDGNGFVNALDYDSFASSFEAGC